MRQSGAACSVTRPASAVICLSSDSPQEEWNMGVLYLIRHGQASFGTDDYDRLSDLGHEQSRLAGRHLGEQGVRPIRIVHGQMLRQKQTVEGILNGLDFEPEADLDPGWNEFNAWELTGALGEIDPRAKHDSTIFQAELERGCARRAGGDFDTDYAETFAEFTDRVDGALDAVFQA